MSFDSLGLAPELIRAVAEEGYTEPTPVQREAIPLVLAGRDVLAGAQTGTGKTAAFVLPMLQVLHTSGEAQRRGESPARAARRPVRALILAPTRELALQVEHSIRTYGRTRPIRSVVIYGGVRIDPQVRELRAGPEIVVATPGRLLDHLGQRTIDLSRVEILVLDEADRMLDMGFIRDIRRILAELTARRQTLLFSATFSDEVRSLANGILVDPASVQVAPRNTAAELVEQAVIPVDRHRKRELLSHLVRSGHISQALVFTRTKHAANRLAEQLGRDGIRAAAIHGNKSQSQRVRALEDFKRGGVGILVATDIAARGIDIDALPHVVNYELPMVASDYVHRIGRTGRAGVDGRAVSLVCVDEAGLLGDIERLLRQRLPARVVPGFEPDASIRPEPIRTRSTSRPSPAPRPSPVRRQISAPRATAAPPQGHAPAVAPGPRSAPGLGNAPGPRQGAAARTTPGPRHVTGAMQPAGRWQHPGGQRQGSANGRAPDRGRPSLALPGERFARGRPDAGRDRAGTGPA